MASLFLGTVVCRRNRHQRGPQQGGSFSCLCRDRMCPGLQYPGPFPLYIFDDRDPADPLPVCGEADLISIAGARFDTRVLGLGGSPS